MDKIQIYPHWEYFLALESDLERATRFVNFSPDHFHVYSIEFTHILLAASSEAEVIMQSLCNKLEPSKPHGEIRHYKETFKTKLPIMLSTEVRVPRYSLSFFPFIAWEKDEKLAWWDSYNKVKHNRSSHYKTANLENALIALSGLFVLILHHYRRTDFHNDLSPLPSLLICPRIPLRAKKSILAELQDLST